MDWNETGSVGDFYAEKAYRSFFGGPVKERAHAAHGLSTIVQSALTLSVEFIWPTLLELSRRVEAGDITLANGWTVRSVKTRDAADATFVMEYVDYPGGFLFNCSRRKDMTGDAMEKIASIVAGKRADAERIADTDIRAAAIEGLKTAELPEVQAVRDDPASYETTDAVNRVTCCVYRADGMYPPGYSDSGSELQETLDGGFGGGTYQHGQLFEIRPSIHLQLQPESVELRTSIPLRPSNDVKDISMSLAAMEVLAQALDELGMLAGVRTRMAALSDIGYRHFSGDPSENLLVQMGMGSVVETGMPREKTLGLVQRYWSATAALDVCKASRTLGATISHMRAAGCVDSDHAFEARNGSYSAFVNPFEGDDWTVLIISTASVAYRLEFRLPEEGAVPINIRAAVVRVPGAVPSESPDPQRRGFLFAFEDEGAFEDESGKGYDTVSMGEMTTANLRSVNGVVLAVEALAEEAALLPSRGTTPALRSGV